MAFQSQLSYYLPFRTYPSVFTFSTTAKINISIGLPTSGKTVLNSTLGDAVLDKSRSKRIPKPFRCLSALTPDLRTTLDKVVTSQKVVIFMKGTKEFPQCGFSNTVVQILQSLNVPFETINILENEILRQGLKEYSNWPTFPQLYIDGEFFGGCDITVVQRQGAQLSSKIINFPPEQALKLFAIFIIGLTVWPSRGIQERTAARTVGKDIVLLMTSKFDIKASHT